MGSFKAPRIGSFCLDHRPVVMPFRGRHLAQIRAMRKACPASFPLDLLVRRPDEVAERYLGGDPIIREALDHGTVLHGSSLVCSA